MNAIERAANRLARLNDWFMVGCRYLLIVLVAVLATILIVSVYRRYVVESSIAWSEEASKYLMVWLAFVGAPIAMRNFAHINIDLLHKAVLARMQQLLHLIVSLLTITTMIILVWKGYGFAQGGMRQVASSFNLSMFYMYIAVPIGAGLTCLVAIEHALRSLVGIADPARGLHALQLDDDPPETIESRSA